MKKMVLALAAVTAVCAQAAVEKALDVRVAPQNGIVEAVGKIGKFIENPMLGSLALNGLLQQPLAEEYGALRPEAGIRFTAYADPATFDFDKLPEGVSGALLYPTTMTKAEFLAKHGENAKETADGAVEYDGDTIVFADNGGWLAVTVSGAGDIPLAKRLIAEESARKPLSGGDLVAVETTSAFWRALKKLAESNELAQTAPDMAKALKCLEDVEGVDFKIRVTDAGVDFASSFVARPGSEFAKLGEKTLAPGTALAFAGKDAAFACAYAADMGQADFDTRVNKIIAILSQHGIATGSFLKYKKTGSVSRFDFDAKALVQYLTEGGCTLNGSAEDLLKEVCEVFEVKEFKVAAPELFIEEYFAGITASEPPAARFAKALPESAGRPLSQAAVLSVYGIFKDVFGQLLTTLPEESSSELDAVKSAYTALPPADGAAMAIMSFKEGGRLKTVFRMTPKEIKGLCQIVMASIPLYQMFVN